MNLGLGGWRVLVTGASGGLGGALVRAVRGEGASVVAQGFGAAEALAARFEADPGVSVRRVDLTRPVEVDRLFVADGPFDGVVVAAGRWPPTHRRLDETAPEDLVATIADNLLTATWTARAWFGQLRRDGPRPGGGSLVMIGSTAGRFGEAGHVGYAVAKAGLRGLCLTLKNEVVALDPLARVNLVEPGWIRTEAVREALEAPGAIARATRTMPLGRIAEPEDVAAVVVGVLSPVLGRHVTGSFVPVAGGMEGRVLR